MEGAVEKKMEFDWIQCRTAPILANEPQSVLISCALTIH